MVLTRTTRRVSAAVVAVGLLLGVPPTINGITHERPVVGLRVAGSPAGAGPLSVWSDAEAAAQAVTRHQADRSLLVRSGAGEQRVTWADLGLVDTTDTLREDLLTVGRDGPWWSNALVQLRAVWGTEAVPPPPARLDPAALTDAVDALAEGLDVAATDAQLVTAGDTVSITPDSTGSRIDHDATTKALVDAVRRGASRVDLPTRPVPAAVTSTDLAGVADVLRAAAGRPLTLAAGDTSVVVPAAHVLSALPVTTTGASPTIGADPAPLAPQIAELAASVDHAARPRIMTAGAVIDPGADGTRLDQDAAVAAVTAELTARAAGRGTDRITLPVTSVPAPVHEVAPGAFTGGNTVHLTFDDGPGAHTEAILDILRDRGVHATFYVVGERARAHPQTLRRILAEGHRLGNHSLTHADLTTLTADQVAHELATTQAIIQEATGVRPTAFRPPFGAVNDVVRAAAHAENLTIDLWSVDPEDWRRPGAQAVRDRVLDAAQPGSVVLLHVLQQGTVDALGPIIDGLRAAGMTLD